MEYSLHVEFICTSILWHGYTMHIDGKLQSTHIHTLEFAAISDYKISCSVLRRDHSFIDDEILYKLSTAIILFPR